MIKHWQSNQNTIAFALTRRLLLTLPKGSGSNPSLFPIGKNSFLTQMLLCAFLTPSILIPPGLHRTSLHGPYIPFPYRMGKMLGI